MTFKSKSEPAGTPTMALSGADLGREVTVAKPRRVGTLIHVSHFYRVGKNYVALTIESGASHHRVELLGTITVLMRDR